MISGSGNWWKNISKTLQTKLGEGEYSGGAFSSPIMTDVNKNDITILNHPASMRHNENTGKDYTIESTAVHDIVYDPDTREMAVRFQPGDGTDYNFVNVSPNDYRDLLKAPSKGHKMWEKFLHNPKFHDPKYPS